MSNAQSDDRKRGGRYFRERGMFRAPFSVQVDTLVCDSDGVILADTASGDLGSPKAQRAAALRLVELANLGAGVGPRKGKVGL